MNGDGIETVRQRLRDNPELEAVVRRRLEGGLLERLGAGGDEGTLATAGAGAAGGGFGGGDSDGGGRGSGGGFEDDGSAEGVDALEGITSSDLLEAIVQRTGRPPLVIRNDQVDLEDPAETLVDFPPGTDARINLCNRDIPSVGRVEFVNFRAGWGGTGWVIAEDGADRIVVTNRHVAGLVAKRTVDGRGVFLRDPFSGAKYQASVDFKEEVGSQPGDARAFQVADILYLADTSAPDVALMRITGQGLPSALPLATAEAAAGALVGLIGYPAFDDRNELTVMARYFRDLYDVKRFAPGRVTQALAAGVVLRHDCTSLGGNSGSPLISLEDGAVVGLHFSGIYGVNNSAVGVETLRALLRGDRPASVVIASGQPESLNDGVHQPADLAGREGFDIAFLGDQALETPWPGLPAVRQADLLAPVDATAARPFELRYTHFGVLFSNERRQPAMTAVNIDGAHRIAIKRGTDKWFRDARIPLDRQLGKDDFADEDIDRGHLVRREDPNWDPAVPVGNPDEAVTELAKRANFDTFHYTNAAPQHGDFNSSAVRWLGLEDHILKSAKTHGFRACVFTGPIFRDTDDDIGGGVVAPREFWKVVAMEDADEHKLHATAYLLSQGQLIQELLEKRSMIEGVEGFVLGPYRTYQIAIADLADATGYDFGPYAAADPLAATDGGQEAVASGEPLFVPLDDVEDAIL